VHDKTPLVTCKDISKTFGSRCDSVTVLDRVSCSFYRGEISLIQGAPGVGKTSFLHIVGLLDPHYTGSLKINGVEIEGLSYSDRRLLRRRHIAFMFQSDVLFNELTLLQNIYITTCDKRTHRTERLERAGACLEAAGLSKRPDEYPFMLSGGQRQKVALARALFTARPILLMDEPTVNLDNAASRELMRAVRSHVHETESTAIIVSHDPLMRGLVDKRLELRGGKLSA